MSLKEIQDIRTLENGARFWEFGKKMLAIAARYKHDITVAIMSVDDPDQADAHVMDLLRDIGISTMRTSDMIAGYGNAGFIFVLPETIPEGGVIFAKRLKTAINGSLPKVSVGVTGWTPNVVVPQFNAIVERAAAALREAQSSGGNKVEWFDLAQ
ncbi:MAG: hypothetical protein MJA83_20320 [Gammaproteobacteria bacterium]|nr:hypothetical protein [Gammaproteobacteria bacterium]